MSKPSNIQISEAMLEEVKSQHPQLDKITQYFEQGADINFQDGEGNTPIIIAVGNDNFKLVELLLSRGANISIRNNLQQCVFEVVKEDDIWSLLRRERPLGSQDRIKTESEIENERIVALIERIKKEREGKPFDVSQLKLEGVGGHFKPKPSQAQIDKLEKHYGHPIPAMLKEIFMNYNGGDSSIVYDTPNYDFTLGYFYEVDENYEDCSNIWNAINRCSDYLGPDTLPFAVGEGDSLVYLKWVEGKSQVWWFCYGGDMVDEDDDESGSDDFYALPVSFMKISNSLEEFFENSYEDDQHGSNW